MVWLRFYWLKEMLLSPLLDIDIFRCAGPSCWEKQWCQRREIERTPGKKTKWKFKSEQTESFNISGHHECCFFPRMKIILLAGQVCLIMEFSRCKHACVFAGAAMLARVLAKGWLWALYFPVKKWDVMKIKPSHARVRCMRKGKAASPWAVAERNSN